MTNGLEITDYYELVALHRALMVARFAREPLNPTLSGSPYLADIARRVVDTLVQMELARGQPERADDWRITIDPSGEVWRIAVQNACSEPDLWRQQSPEQKAKLARVILSPFVYTDELVDDFIRQVDKQADR